MFNSKKVFHFVSLIFRKLLTINLLIRKLCHVFQLCHHLVKQYIWAHTAY
jgi:hypothetical protein